MVKKSLLWFYRVTLAALWLIIIVLALSVLTMRYVVLPHIGDYKDRIAERVSSMAKQKVAIGEIRASWHGLYPHLSLFKVDIYDAQNRPALALEHIEASLSWLSLVILEPRFASIAVYKPALIVRREANGMVYVAGIAMGGPARPEFPNWALKQSQIDIIDAVVLWQDDLRQAPPLTLNKLNLQIVSPAWEGLLGHHRFGLNATPSAGSSYPIDIRGDVYGKDVAKPTDWSGTLYARLEGTDIAAWRNWLTYPVDLREGFGAARAWVEFADGKLTEVTSDALLSNVRSRVAKTGAEAVLNSLSGRLRWKQHRDGQEISAERLKIVTADGLHMQNGKLALRERLVDGKQSLEGNVNLDELKLESVYAFANLFPIPRHILQKYAEISPAGTLSNLRLQWKGDPAAPSNYALRTDFKGLGIKPYLQVPGFSNLSGTIDADQDNGTLTLNSRQAILNFEKVMRWPIPADRLTGNVTWNKGKTGTEVQASNVAIANAHLAGTINVKYLHPAANTSASTKGGYLDLKGKFAHADAKFARFYFPSILGEHTLHWLDTSIIDGRGEDVNVTVKGYLHEFPYPGNKLGLFKVTAKVTDGVLHFAQEWPQIDGIKLDLLFEGNRMELNASAGNTAGNKITKAKISIPELHVAEPVLDIVGEGQGLVSDGINYVNSSPIHRLTQGFTDNLRTTGNGKLNLELHIPLHDTEATKIKGSYLVSNGSMAGEGFPELSKLNGKLEFTESMLRAQNASTWVYGGPAAFNLISGKDHVMRIAARGRVTDAGIRQALGTGLWDRLSGSAEWLGAISIFDKQLDISINSNLLGMASTLPAPLGKAANDSMALRFDKKHASASQDTISLSIGNVLGAKLQRTGQPGQLVLDRGEIGLNVVPELPSQPGLALRGSMDYLDFDEWQSLLTSTQKSINSNTNGSSASSDTPSLNRVDLAVNTLDVMDRRINGLKLIAKPASDGWQANIQSREINGDAQWHNAKAGDNGKLSAKLKTLIIPSAVPNTAELRTQGNFKQQQADSYPALDITVDNFEFGKKKLGRLELQASEQNEDWSIEKLRIINPESTLSAEGEWHNWKRNPNTRMTINWDINDLGKTLERFGYPDTVKGGEADLTGQLKWPGSPHEFDFPGLSGNLQIDARKGQILKIRPGVGRLFSVLSLQNLPRRLTFDFRDVFSSGFTFDKVNVSVRIDKGVMRSDDFKMDGPVARVEMSGETDLQKETQHLNVKVTPYISDSLSLAALAGGPVVGAAAYIAQKLLKDPLNKLAADEYEIGGTWDNPQELKTPSVKPVVPGNTPLGK